MAGVASAGEFQVEPTRLDLARRGAATELTITNRGHAAARFEAKIFAWHQDAQGAMQLEPALDMVVYPTLFTVEPGAKRSIRIATSAAPAATERTFRVFVEELPGKATAATAGAPTTVAVLTRIGVPIFLAPTTAVVRGDVAGSIQPGALQLALANHGTVHVKVASVRVVGSDGSGNVLFDRSQAGWYVLAGESRAYTLPLDAHDCAGLDHVAIAATTDRGAWQTTLTGGCLGAP